MVFVRRVESEVGEIINRLGGGPLAKAILVNGDCRAR